MRERANKLRVALIVATGFMAHEVLAHMWMGIDGMLPFTSRLGITMTPLANTMLMIVDVIALLFVADFAFAGPAYRITRKKKAARH